MGVKVLILGESGTGKSASMRNFTKDELYLVNVANKPLPFKQKGGKFESICSDNYRDIKRMLAVTPKKSIAIDDAQYLMANEFMRRATEKGFDKFTEIGQNYWELAKAIDTLPDDSITYVFSHIDRDQNGNEKIKTIGKLLDEKITIEGMYTIVLKTVVQDGKYYFQTQNSGHDTCKSPIGMFDSFLIDNDLKAVDTAIREYYDLAPLTAEAIKKQAEKQIAAQPDHDEDKKTFAEKVADYVNKEPGAEEPKVEEAPTRTRTRRRAVAAEEAKPTEEVKAEVVEEATPTRRRRVVSEVVTEEVKAEEPKQETEAVEETPVRRTRRRA